MTKVAILCRERSANAIEGLHSIAGKGVEIGVVVVESHSPRRLTKRQYELLRNWDAYEIWLGRKSVVSTLKKAVQYNLGLIPAIFWNLINRWMSYIPILRTRTVRFHARWKGIPILTVEKHSHKETLDALIAMQIDYCLLFSSAWLIKDPLLGGFKGRILNAHLAPLPAHRSLDALPRTLLSGDTVGNTVHIVDAGIDTGEILHFVPCHVLPTDDLLTLGGRLNMDKARAFQETLLLLAEGKIVPVKQSGDQAVHPLSNCEELIRAHQAISIAASRNSNQS